MQVSLTHIVPINYSIYMDACLYFLPKLLDYLCVIYFHDLFLLTGLGKTLEYFYIMLSLTSL
jgi:hypothetical protein